MTLTGKEIQDRQIITEVINEDIQIQPCGIDLTVASIESYASSGEIDFDNSKRKLPRMELTGRFGDTWKLSPGAYLVTFKEVVNVPPDCMGLARPRSTLLRLGATVETSIWDPGYKGRSQSMLVVHNRNGITIHPSARLVQMVFLPLNKVAEKLYTGIYNGENLK